jgi:hypothetical protein
MSDCLPYFAFSDTPLPIELRDPHIRGPLDQWIRAQHSSCAETEILHELKMPRPSARIDIAVINGELCGFEIKSDVDSLTRLSRQGRAFSAVFDRVAIVTTSRHISAAINEIPSWWGVLRVEVIGQKTSFFPEREPGENPSPDGRALLHMLSRRELVELLQQIEPREGLRAARRDALVDAIASDLPASVVREEVRMKLKERGRHHSSASKAAMASGP